MASPESSSLRFGYSLRKICERSCKIFNLFSMLPVTILSEEHLVSIGGIILLGYVLTGYLPSYFNSASLYCIMIKTKPSEELIMCSFYGNSGCT